MSFKLLFQVIGYFALIALGHSLIYILIELDTSSSSSGDPHAGIGKGLAFVYFNLWFLGLLLVGSLVKLIVHLRAQETSAMGYLYFPLTLFYVLILFSLYMGMA